MHTPNSSREVTLNETAACLHPCSTGLLLHTGGQFDVLFQHGIMLQPVLLGDIM